MKKALLMAAALLLAPMAVVAADYQEGVHYTVLRRQNLKLLSFSPSIVHIVIILLRL